MNLKNLWNKIIGKKEKTKFPHKFALIRYSDSAKEKGILDTQTALIEVYKNGEIESIMPYSKELVKALEDIDQIPVVWEKFEEKDIYEFYQSSQFGSVNYRR